MSPCVKQKKESIYLTPDSTRKGYYPAKGEVCRCYYYGNLLQLVKTSFLRELVKPLHERVIRCQVRQDVYDVFVMLTNFRHHLVK